MHLIFAMRGIKHNMDRCIGDLQAQYSPLKRKDVKTGEEHEIMVQWALRPIQLFELVFPETALRDVLTTLNLDSGKEGYWGEKKGAKAKVYLPLIRKALGAEPVPKVEPTPTMRIIMRDGVGIEPIGIKHDGKVQFPYAADAERIPWYKGKDGKFEQEAL